MRDNSLNFWFPILKELGINVPDTIAIDLNKYDLNCVKALKKMFWMDEMTEQDNKSLGQFVSTMAILGRKIGYPLFLRSGHTSHKHNWLGSCYVPDEESIGSHIQDIAEHSCMANMDGGWPLNVWVLRRLIPTTPIFIAFNGFPVTREFRFFFRNHKLECMHPYWPEEAIENHTEEKKWRRKLRKMNTLTKEEEAYLIEQTNKIAEKFEGWWSLDWLQGTDKKWYAIDMALGEDSYHFPTCEHKQNEINT